MATPNPMAPTPGLSMQLTMNGMTPRTPVGTPDPLYEALAAHPDLQAALDRFGQNQDPDAREAFQALLEQYVPSQGPQLPTSSSWQDLLSNPLVKQLGGDTQDGMTNFLRDTYGLPGDYHTSGGNTGIEQDSWLKRNLPLLIGLGIVGGAGGLGAAGAMGAGGGGLGATAAGEYGPMAGGYAGATTEAAIPSFLDAAGIGGAAGSGLPAGVTLEGLSAGGGGAATTVPEGVAAGTGSGTGSGMTLDDYLSLTNPSGDGTGIPATSEFGPFSGGYQMPLDITGGSGIPDSLLEAGNGVVGGGGGGASEILSKLFGSKVGSSSLSDAAKMLGAFSQSGATNRSVAAGLQQNNDRLALQGQTSYDTAKQTAQDAYDQMRQKAGNDYFSQEMQAAANRRAGETDAWQKLAAGDYVLGGGQHGFPQVSPYQGSGPAAPGPGLTQAAQSLQGQLLGRLLPGGMPEANPQFQPTPMYQPSPMFKPTPVSQFSTPGTGENIANGVGLGLGALGAAKSIFGLFS